MGYGGALIWTGLARNLKKAYPDKKIIFLFRGTPREILLNKPISDHVIYQNNDDIFLVTSKLKWFFLKRNFGADEVVTVDMDDPKCRYWGKQTREKIEFKTQKHAIERACHAYGLTDIELKPKIVLSGEEISQIDQLLRENNLEKNVRLALDVASSSFYSNGFYKVNGKEITKENLEQFYSDNSLVLEKGLSKKAMYDKAIEEARKISLQFGISFESAGEKIADQMLNIKSSLGDVQDAL